MDHPIIQFKPRLNPLLQPKNANGFLIGDYLVVSYATPDLSRPTFTLYNVCGKRLFGFAFSEAEGVVKLAEWLENIFHDYLPIWEEYPEADVFGLARWSVQNGVNIYEVLKKDHGLR